MRQKRSDWRCRREEYLRATGRRDDLISEGYEAAPPPSPWIVLPGGRGGKPREQPVSISLRLVKERVGDEHGVANYSGTGGLQL